jgi:hypothetical protein
VGYYASASVRKIHVDAGTINDQVDWTSGRTPASHFYKSLFQDDISTRLRSSTSVAIRFHFLS